MSDLPIACSLTPAALATRKQGLLADLVARVEARIELSEGYRLKFASDCLSPIVEAVEAERHCCRFLRFQITVEQDGGPIWLDLTGPPGTREFLSDLVGQAR
jgi:hypothetical protein